MGVIYIHVVLKWKLWKHLVLGNYIVMCASCSDSLLGASVAEWLWLLTSNHFPFTGMGAKFSRDF
jgi:hypothetical protein